MAALGPLWCMGFPPVASSGALSTYVSQASHLQCLLLWNTGSRSTWTSAVAASGSRAQMQWLWPPGLVAPWPVIFQIELMLPAVSRFCYRATEEPNIFIVMKIAGKYCY